jgi:hypothetical protein
MTASSAWRLRGGTLGSRSSPSSTSSPLNSFGISRKSPSGNQPQAAKRRRCTAAPRVPTESFAFETPQIDRRHAAAECRRLACVGLGFLGRGACYGELSGDRQVTPLDRRGRRARICTQAAVERCDERSGGYLGFSPGRTRR